MRLKLPAFLLCISALIPWSQAFAGKMVYGLNEYVYLNEVKLQLTAKLDTGAKTASLSAHNIKRFKRDGATWVRFYLASDSTATQPIEKPLARISKIKRRHGDYEPEEGKSFTPRPVVELEVCMGKRLRTIEVNLTDRSAFQYPLLIGSDALKHFGALIDPSLKYAAGKPSCQPVAKNN